MSQTKSVHQLDQMQKEWRSIASNDGFDKAIERCIEQTSETKFEHSFRVISFLGYAYHQLQQYDCALKYLSQAVRERPSNIQNSFFLGRTQEALGNVTEALHHYVQAWELGAEQFPALKRAIAVSSLCQGSDEALDLETKLREQAASNPQMEIHWQTFLFKQKRFDELSTSLASSAQPEDELPQFRHIISVKDWVEKYGGEYSELGKAEPIRIAYPLSDGSILEEGIVYSNVPYVAVLSSVTVAGGCSLIYDDNANVISDTLAHSQYGHFVDLQNDEQVISQYSKELLVKGGVTHKSISKGIMLSGLFSKHFGHWFAEFLPRLCYLEQHPKFSSLPIIVDEDMPLSHYEFLNAVTKNELYRLSKGERLRVDYLLVAPTMTFCPVKLFQNHTIPREHQGSWAPSALRYLRDRVLKHYGKRSGDFPGKIFISRKNSRWRCLLNEDELIGELKPLGFRVVCLEEYGFEEQVRIFQNAELIIAPNGSVLNSLIFSEPGVKVVVLSQEEQFNWGGWFGPIMELGYRPRLVTGKCVGVEGKKHANYFVDPKDVLDAVVDPENVV